MHARKPILVSLSLAVLAAGASAQQNVIPGTDVALGQLGDIDSVGRTGTFPNGTTGAAMSTTSCNFGSVEVPWFQVPDEDHPFIAFLVTREDDSGRIYQISDRSAVKHGFFALADNQCNLGCNFPAQFGQVLGVGCSDTYGISNNSDKFWLGPADEIDPWLGEWEMTCSFFDLGLTGTVCDGNRSFSQTQANNLGPVGTRINLKDADLIDNGTNAQFAYQAYYVIEGEPEAARDNNYGWRRMTATFGTTSWNLNPTTSLAQGSILESWTGATVSSNTNGNDDGRVLIGVKVTGPKAGRWHYEYALHNRDNARGVREFRIPVCPNSQITNIGFRDIDGNAANDWTASVVGGELVLTGTNNALEWNTIYNVWFDSDAAPEPGNFVLVQDLPGPGAGSFAVSTQVPTRRISYSLGQGCALSGVPPQIYVSNNSPIPSIGNASFAISSAGQVPGAFSLLYASGLNATLPVPPSCTLYLGGLFGVDILQYSQAVADGSGRATYALPIPSNAALEGVVVQIQAAVVNIGGPFAGIADLTNGLRVRIGSATTGC